MTYADGISNLNFKKKKIFKKTNVQGTTLTDRSQAWCAPLLVAVHVNMSSGNLELVFQQLNHSQEKIDIRTSFPW